jgi:hypothetical protein
MGRKPPRALAFWAALALTIRDVDRLHPAALLGLDDVREHVVPGARDRVLVARLDDGGVISYARADGSYLHTLGTAEGFARKLAALGLEPGKP